MPGGREDTSTRVFRPENKPHTSVCLPSVKKRDFFLEVGEKRTEVKTQHGSGEAASGGGRRLHRDSEAAPLLLDKFIPDHIISCVKRGRTGDKDALQSSESRAAPP